jgi:hypothetical protein
VWRAVGLRTGLLWPPDPANASYRLVLANRRSGLVIVLVASLLASGIPIVHMTGPGLAGGKVANTSGAYFFVWTLIALGVTTLFSVVLSACELWWGPRGRSDP